MKPWLKTSILALLLAISLSSCINIRKMVGLDNSIIDFPPGDYVGKSELVLPPGSNGEAVIEDVKITFLPKEPDLKDGIGVLVMNNNSQRFFWRTDGNNVDSWNVLFHKDQNLYSSMSESFKFDGLIHASEVSNQLEGRLHFNRDLEVKDYFVTAAQIFKPEIFEPKEALEIKAGDELEIQVAKVGSDPDDIKVFYRAAEGSKASEFSINKFTKDPKEGTKIILPTDKKFPKGNYSLYLERGGEHRSNKISFTVK